MKSSSSEAPKLKEIVRFTTLPEGSTFLDDQRAEGINSAALGLSVILVVPDATLYVIVSNE